MSLRSYYERQAATSRRLAEQAMTQEIARRMLAAANDYEQRARACEILDLPVVPPCLAPQTAPERT